MGRTSLGQSMPYCPTCRKYVGKLSDRFGVRCPNCGTQTVDYDKWQRRLLAEQRARIDARRRVIGSNDFIL